MAGRRLQRDREPGMIGGVCAGLAAHFDYDVTLLRFVTVLLAFAGGIGGVAYLVLWVLLPAAGSTRESPAGNRGGPRPVPATPTALMAMAYLPRFGRLCVGDLM